MPNQVLDRLRTDRESQIDFVDQLLSRVDEDGRDLVDAERANLDSARSRIAELDQQIEPLEAFEAMRGTHTETTRELARTNPRPADPNRRALGQGSEVVYSSAGSVLVDMIRAAGYMNARTRDDVTPDATAVGRLNRAVAQLTTDDITGLLPEPVVGPVVNLIDANRPFITSVGPKSMGGIPGKIFTRPKVTQHTLVGPQSAEKAELPTRELTVTDVPFTKTTFGGTVNVSRQAIDWSSPAAWNILVNDLAAQYAKATENAAADDFAVDAASVNAAIPVATNDLAGWSEALYAAAAAVYAASSSLPNRIWCSIDVWAALGPMVDQARLVFSPGLGMDSSLSSFSGVVLDLPRIVVPSFPAATCVVGSASAYEVYEETIGLLTAVEPSILGVEVAYGGYIAYGSVAPEALVTLTPPAPIVGASSSSKSSSK